MCACSPLGLPAIRSGFLEGEGREGVLQGCCRVCACGLVALKGAIQYSIYIYHTAQLYIFASTLQKLITAIT